MSYQIFSKRKVVQAANKKVADPPPLTDAYRKVHKQCGVFVGLLFAWELIGIDVTDKPLSTVDVRFKSPEAVPYFLIVLVTYFGYRLTIEWMQCNMMRRAIAVTRLDFFLTHGLALLAILTFIYQAYLHWSDFQRERWMVHQSCPGKYLSGSSWISNATFSGQPTGPAEYLAVRPLL